MKYLANNNHWPNNKNRSTNYNKPLNNKSLASTVSKIRSRKPKTIWRMPIATLLSSIVIFRRWKLRNSNKPINSNAYCRPTISLNAH
ncbi:Uncharacterised protein [Vibrio cholerae]|nr:Uncharacterised protein [Vibrio cholerae]